MVVCPAARRYTPTPSRGGRRKFRREREFSPDRHADPRHAWHRSSACCRSWRGTTGGCATIRTTDPPRTATEQFLLSGAASRARSISSPASRSATAASSSTRRTSGSSQTANEYAFLIGELRAKLLLSGIRLVPKREEAQILLELRSGGLGIDRLEYLLGIPSLYLPTATQTTVPVATPELAIVKSTKQRGYASVAYVAYWADTGEVVAHSGPFIGTNRPRRLVDLRHRAANRWEHSTG